MASLRDELLETLDGRLSGDPSRYWVDVKPLWTLPILPLLLALAFVPLPSTAGYVIAAAGLLIELAWILFLNKRWRRKAAAWRPAERFSDDPSGY